MFSRSAWLHLRIPFSYFLLPVFLFALAVSPNFNGPRIGWVFLIMHFFLYPASNGFNSYFDKDEKSIGGLKNPPPVNKGLYYLSLLFDLIAITLGFLKVNPTFALMLLIYGAVSKAYSHPSIRLKKYPITGWIITGLFQGIFTFLMCYVGLNDFAIEDSLQSNVLIGGILTTIMLWANYPLTQVYQHEEDLKRGDITLSLKLGIRGTFLFSMICFTLAAVGFLFFFNRFYEGKYSIWFLFALMPVLMYFMYWFSRVYRDQVYANYRHTMLLNFISATCLNAFFIYLFLDSSQVMQVVSRS
jgi:hypothetical protein